MDREDHARFLAYLNRYTYFGRGRERLTRARHAEVETELASLDASQPATRDPAVTARIRELEKLLLRD